MSKMYQKIFCLHEFSYQTGTDTVIRVEKNGLFRLNIPVCNADIFDDWNVLLVMDCLNKSFCLTRQKLRTD